MEERLGDRVRHTRERYGMPAAELARRAGISRNQLYLIETNKAPDPGALTVMAIADALGVTTDFLIKGRRRTRRKTDDEEREPALKVAPVG